jgi:hypothetical protein
VLHVKGTPRDMNVMVVEMTLENIAVIVLGP